MSVSAQTPTLPGGVATRRQPAGLAAGAPLSVINGPVAAMKLVAPELAQAEVKLRELVISDVAAVPTVAGYLVNAGGKRFRPALTALASRTIGYEGDVVSLMCAGEMLHIGSLLHDDVVDGGNERRGRPAAHTVWGNPVAVLSGDFCLARSVLLAAEAGGHRVVTELGHAITRMAEGEVLQLQRAHDLSTDLEGYLDVIERKSAALIAWCAAAPAWAMGDERNATALARFGRRAGVAFQVTDDVLDFHSGTGKVPGADVREGKITLPLLVAFDADPTLRDRVAAGVGNPDATAELLVAIRATGALDRALAYADNLINEAIDGLTDLPDGPGKDALAMLGRTLVDRAT
jgi:octaprenyl-diphosphate synthase